MISSENYYCWMRLLPAAGVARLHQQVEASMLAVKLGFLAGPRPPKVTAVRSVGGGNSGTASSRPIGWWFADDDFCGDPRAVNVVDYGPAFEDRNAAITWISGAEGGAWASEALNYFLFCFSLDDPSTDTASLQDKVALPAPATASSP